MTFSHHINEIPQKGLQRIRFQFVALSLACMFLAPYTSTSLEHPVAVLANCTKSKYNYAVKDLEYQSRLKHLKLPRLGYRGKKADMLQVFRYLKRV